MDIVDQSTRSQMMSTIRGGDTAPEMLARSYLHRAGLRFKVHAKGLPGRPDIVLPMFKTAVFIHGCFWHRHEGCKLAAVPATRTNFWLEKFAGNVARDARNNALLDASGWNVIVVWECQLCDRDTLDELFWRIVSNSPRQRSSPHRTA